MVATGLLADPRVAQIIARVDPVDRSTLARFHTRAYVDRVARSNLGGRMFRWDDPETPIFPGAFTSSARIVGGGLTALSAVLNGRSKRAFVPAGGHHHARRDRAGGFCVFNDLGVLIATALEARSTRHRVACIDLDAHHGDGVQYGFYGSDRVLHIDFHQDGRTLYPGSGAIDETGLGDGEGLTVNVPLPPGSGDRLFTGLFRRIVPPLVREFRPTLVVVQQGVDALRDDGLADLALGPESYTEALSICLDLAEELCSGRLIVTGGGGYNPLQVAPVLARTGFLLCGKRPPLGPLPEPWRLRYRQALGTPAPTRWPSVRRGRTGPRTPSDIARIVSGLERVLRRPLPRSR